jgi:NADPH2:quinone reductase
MPRAVVVHAPGGPEALAIEDVALGDPGPGQARVRHEAIGINFIDTYHRSGLYALPMPTGIGSEAAGVVEAVGEGVVDIAVGDRVAYAGASPGSYADARLIAADRLVKLPDAIDFETAAAMMLKGMTVEYLVRRTFRVEPGMTVLWHAAAGGVGLIACQWLSAMGVTVIGTVGSREKAELARAHGCTHVIDYTRESFVERVRELTDGKGVPVVYDSVGRTTFMGSLDCLRPRGMLVVFGNASGKPDPFDPQLLSTKGSLYLTRPTLFAYTAARSDLLESAAALFDAVTKGRVKIEIHQRWKLADVQAAHRALESRATTGSSILVP